MHTNMSEEEFSVVRCPQCRKKKKKPVFSFSMLMESCHFSRYDIPTISLMICVVLITLSQEHAACSPCRIHMDKNTDALLVCSPTLCTESSHNIVKYKRSLLTGSWLHRLFCRTGREEFVLRYSQRLLTPLL